MLQWTKDCEYPKEFQRFTVIPVDDPITKYQSDTDYDVEKSRNEKNEIVIKCSDQWSNETCGIMYKNLIKLFNKLDLGCNSQTISDVIIVQWKLPFIVDQESSVAIVPE